MAFGESKTKERILWVINYRKLTVISIVLCIAVFAAFGFLFMTNLKSAGNTPDIPVQKGQEEQEIKTQDAEQKPTETAPRRKRQK